jgi:bacterioferritin-associated ferredoxin
MIVCSCNVLTDDDVRSALARIVGPRTAGQIYGSLGCRPQCGCCARTIRQIMDEELAAIDADRHCRPSEEQGV